MLFDTPVAAWGADFFASGTSVGVDFWLIPTDYQAPGDLVFFNGANTFQGFFGFVDFSGDRYAGLMITSGSISAAQRFGMDNVTGASIPEPSPAALLTLGLSGLAVAGRRRRRR
jgi:hypothetical protein